MITSDDSPSIDLASALEQEPELAMMVSQPPIAFHRSFVDVTGSATAALLLSTCMEQSESALTPDGWFSVSAQDWEVRTGLSRKEQITARKNLKDKRLIEERRSRFPATMEMRINFDRLSVHLLQAARKRTQQMRDRRNVGVSGAAPVLAH